METVPHRTLIARYGVNGKHPVLEVDDMLPGGRDETNPPGLTLGLLPMPCLSRTPIGHFGNVIGSRGSVPITETILEIFAACAHSPKLPQFSPVQLESVPCTVLKRNQTHDSFTVVKSTTPVLHS